MGQEELQVLDAEPVFEGDFRPTTVRERILEELQKMGIEEPSSAEVTFRSGESELISSDRHPALDRPADEMIRLTFKQDAEAGFTIQSLQQRLT